MFISKFLQSVVEAVRNNLWRQHPTAIPRKLSHSLESPFLCRSQRVLIHQVMGKWLFEKIQLKSLQGGLLSTEMPD